VTGPLFEPGLIGPVEIRNRFVRAGTSETMAGREGEVTEPLIGLYETLARNQVGLVVTGHLYCEPRGQYAVRQSGLHSDALLPGLRRLTDGVHRHGGRIFAQVAHAGSQSRVPALEPLSPSPVPNELTGRVVGEATEEEIESTLAAFAAAARRAAEAGFDGVHLHGANGYLISEFSSPLTNRRTDRWGGSQEGRDRFVLEIVRRVRVELPAHMALTMKIGFVDATADDPRLTLDESVPRAARLVAAGLDAIEVSCNVMQKPSDSAAQYVAVDNRRALRDYLVHRLGKPAHQEAYFAPWARALRKQVETTVVLVGGMRTRETMESLMRDRVCDFVALARPVLREPDHVQRFAHGRDGVGCTSCNLCLTHEGHHSLRCWRIPRRRLLQHAVYRFTGGFERGETLKLLPPDKRSRKTTWGSWGK
jgi:2,4-dienoyl-CoA reductase-like NADH-dependent reductase (Old Yellow Enzyme family)